MRRRYGIGRQRLLRHALGALKSWHGPSPLKGWASRSNAALSATHDGNSLGNLSLYGWRGIGAPFISPFGLGRVIRILRRVAGVLLTANPDVDAGHGQ